jgi:hypothetical protein
MNFRISGDVQEIVKLLDVFIKEAEDEYRKQIGSSRVINAVKKINRMSPVPIATPSENGFKMGYYEEKGKGSVVFGMPSVPIPIKLIRKKAEKKMVGNLEGYFKANGLDVKVEVVKED